MRLNLLINVAKLQLINQSQNLPNDYAPQIRGHQQSRHAVLGIIPIRPRETSKCFETTQIFSILEMLTLLGFDLTRSLSLAYLLVQTIMSEEIRGIILTYLIVLSRSSTSTPVNLPDRLKSSK